ncbi:MAG: MFS transporter, partial [Geminicoccaceae bacterium]
MRALTTEHGLRTAAPQNMGVDSRYSWLRLGITVLLGGIGGVGMWSVVVALPAVQAEFGVARAGASLPYTLTVLGLAAGGVLMGRAVDRFGVVRPLLVAVGALTLGYIGSAFATSLWQFAAMQGLLIGLGCSATFGPLMADVSHWFVQRRGIAVAICASGSYLAGAVWPPVVAHFIGSVGWRHTQIGIGVFCAASMLPLVLALRRKSPIDLGTRVSTATAQAGASLGLSSGTLQTLLFIAGIACCVAMAMPQVHIVPYCGDLGYGVARGAQMLSLMLGFGIVSRVGSG